MSATVFLEVVYLEINFNNKCVPSSTDVYIVLAVNWQVWNKIAVF